MQKGAAGIFILVGILVVGLGIAGAWYTKLIQIPGFAPPGCRYQQVQCIKAPCKPTLVCGGPSLSIEPIPSTSGPGGSTIPTSSDETANWKTYQDADGGFEFKYPINASAKKDQVPTLSKDYANGLQIEPPYQEPYSQWYTLTLGIQDNTENSDPKSLINNFAESLKKDCSPPGCTAPVRILETVEEYKNNEVSGYIFHNGAETDWVFVAMSKNNKIYVFTISGDQGYVNDYTLRIFDRILSTFKFLK